MSSKKSLKKIILKVKHIGENKIRERKNKKITELERIRKLSSEDFILEYTKVKANYKFHKNILKYVFTVIAIGLTSSFGIGVYKVAWSYINVYGGLSEEQKNIVTITAITLLGVLVILIIFMLIVIFLYFKLIQRKECELELFEELKDERKKNNG